MHQERRLGPEFHLQKPNKRARLLGQPAQMSTEFQVSKKLFPQKQQGQLLKNYTQG